MKKTKFLYPLFLLLFSQAWATECPPPNAPLCPDSGSTLLDETYPTQAFVMSNGPSFKRRPPPSKEQLEVTRNYINTILRSYDYKNVPQVILALSTEEEFNRYKKLIEQDLIKQNIKKEEIEKILGQLTHLQTPNFTWQQDYFESFVDLKTGTAQVRHIESYTNFRQPPYRNTTSDMAKAGAQCGITEGEAIKYDSNSFNSGEMGGNIEGAPGGFCLVGNNQGTEFTKSFCGKKENIITINTSWLSVGHVDEIFKIVPNGINDGRPKECQFSLMAASPNKALELLKDSKYRNRSFFDFGADKSDDDLEDLRDSRSNIYNMTNSYLCDFIVNGTKDKVQTPAKSNNDVKSVLLKVLLKDAYADVSQGVQIDIESFKNRCKQNITSVTNEEMFNEFSKDVNNFELNQYIQKSIDKDKENIKKSILSRLPQCTKYFDVIDVPNYFEGGPLVDKGNGQKELPLYGNINAFLPNPTNSVLMNKTLLIPEAGNSAQNDYLKEELEKRKLKAEFIGTWDYSHLGMGNIHCSSHSLPYCTPRGK